MRKEDILDRISALKTIEDLDAATIDISKHLGMDGYYYCNFKPMTGLNTVDHRDEEWLKRYSSLGYQQFDIITQVLFSSDQSFTWEEVALTNALDKRQHIMLDEARVFGLNEGYQVVSKENPFQGGTCCYYASDRRDFGDSMKKNKAILDMLGHLYHEKYEEITSTPNSLPQLSPREKECLTLAALGKTNDEIGTILTLSSNTVNSYIRSASLKLDVRTKIHAVVKAVQLQIIFPF